MSNVTQIFEECPRCGFYPAHGHSPLCVYRGKQTNLNPEQIAAIDRYLINTQAKIVFPDGSTLRVSLEGASADEKDDPNWITPM